MSLKKFKPNEIFTNTMKAHPRCEFQILEGRVIYNNVPNQVGQKNDEVRNVDTNLGYISLFEYNIDVKISQHKNKDFGDMSKKEIDFFIKGSKPYDNVDRISYLIKGIRSGSIF